MALGTRLPPSTEFALAIDCCSPPNANRLRSASKLAEKVDWMRFLATCRRHRVQGLAWRSLRQMKLTIPDDIAEEFASDSMAIAQHGLIAASVSQDILAEMNEADIPILFVKGLTLSKLAYADTFVKMSQDVDLLVSPNDLDSAASILGRHGYHRALPRTGRLATWHVSQKESVWVRKGYPTIDLHSRLANNPRLIPKIGLCSPQQNVEVTPGVILPTLELDLLIIYLCVHGASSAWFRLKWIADLAALLVQYDPAGIDELTMRAVQLGSGRSAPSAFRLARDLFDVNLGPVTERMIATIANSWLSANAYRELSKPVEPMRRRFGTLRIHLHQLILMPGLAFKADEALRQFRTTLAKS